MMKLMVSLIALMPYAAVAGEDQKSGSGGELLGLIVLAAVLAMLFMLWHAKDWIEGKADESKELARKLRLENDRVELENKARANELGIE